MKIVGLSNKGAKWLPIIISWIVFLLVSGIYLTHANANQVTREDLMTAPWSVRIIDIKHKVTGQEERVLHLYGDFSTGIADAVDKLLEKHKVKHAVLNSPGGNSAEGYKLGTVFSKHKTTTYVAKGTYCLSACAVAFIGGEDYIIKGQLGFHRAWITDGWYENDDEGFTDGQRAGTYSTYYWLANGFSIDLPFYEVHKTDPNNFIIFTNENDLLKYYVRTKGDDTPLNDYLSTDNVPEPNIWHSNKIFQYQKNNPNDNKWKVLKIVDEINNFKNK